MITRRGFLKASLTAGASGLALGGYTWLVEPHWLEIVHHPMPVAGLPEALRGGRIALLSDLHVGTRVSDDYILDTFRQVRDLSPDIVVFTGDFTSHEPGIFEHAERIYQHLPQGRLATLGVLGNHDYGINWAQPKVGQRFIDIFRNAGLRILRNEVTDVAGLQVAGLDDLWALRFDPVRGLAALDRSRPAIALSHNPDTVDRPGWDGFHGWIFSGHTHGGQCKAPFLPPPMLPVKNRRYTAGEFALSGERRLYISRGVGHLLKVRFNVRPEVTMFELQPA